MGEKGVFYYLHGHEKTFRKLDWSTVEQRLLHEEVHERTNVVFIDIFVGLIVENEFGEKLSALVGSCGVDV